MTRHATPRHATPRHATPRHATPRILFLLLVRALRATLLLAAFLILFSSPVFAALDINKAGDLEATEFDELGFDTTGLVGYWQLNGNAVDSLIKQASSLMLNSSILTLIR